MEYNLGIHRICVVCETHFWCTDGDYTCSGLCADRLEQEFYNDKMEDIECQMENLIIDLKDGDVSEKKFKKDWNMIVYDAIHIKDIYEEDIKSLEKKLKEEYQVSI